MADDLPVETGDERQPGHELRRGADHVDEVRHLHVRVERGADDGPDRVVVGRGLGLDVDRHPSSLTRHPVQPPRHFLHPRRICGSPHQGAAGRIPFAVDRPTARRWAGARPRGHHRRPARRAPGRRGRPARPGRGADRHRRDPLPRRLRAGRAAAGPELRGPAGGARGERRHQPRRPGVHQRHDGHRRTSRRRCGSGCRCGSSRSVPGSWRSPSRPPTQATLERVPAAGGPRRAARVRRGAVHRPHARPAARPRDDPRGVDAVGPAAAADPALEPGGRDRACSNPPTRWPATRSTTR